MKDEPEHCSFCVLSKDDKTFPDLLNALKKQPDTSLATAPVITWAFADNAGLESQSLDGVYIESFVHASTSIRLGLLKRVLPENQMTDAGEIMQATFEEVPPDPGNDYIFSPTIKKFLDETSLDLLTVDKQKRENYREEEWSKTCFGCRTIRYSSFEQVAKVRSANVAHRQEATLNSTSVKTVAFAAPAHESATANIMQVEVLLHSSGVSFDSAKASHTCAIPPSKSYSRRPRWTRQRAPHWPVKGRASTCPTPAETRPKRLGLAGRKQGWPSTPPKPPEGMPWRRAALSALPCRRCRTRWRRIQRKGNRQARLAPRRRPASRWHCRGCCVWWRLGSLTRVRRRDGSRGVGSCIAIFVLVSGHFEPRCKERSIICP